MDGIHGAKTDGATLRRIGTDGAAWAREMSAAFWNFAHPVPGSPIDPEPGGLLHVWLVNAIEAGRAAGYAEGAEAGRLTGWREALAQLAPPPELAADLAGSHAADSAGSVPADLAGRFERARTTGLPLMTLDAGSDRVADALEELVTLVRAVVSPSGHPAGGGVRVIGDGR